MERLETTTSLERLAPYAQKYDYGCGMASLYIVYRAFGIQTSEAEIIAEMGCGREGAAWSDMFEHTHTRGLKTFFQNRLGWNILQASMEKYQSPAVVCWMSDRDPPPGSHFSVVKRIDLHRITLLDPGYGDEITFTREEFEDKWEDAETSRAFMIIYEG